MVGLLYRESLANPARPAKYRHAIRLAHPAHIDSARKGSSLAEQDGYLGSDIALDPKRLDDEEEVSPNLRKFFLPVEGTKTARSSLDGTVSEIQPAISPSGLSDD